jgi:hypothetical protein
MSKRKGKTNIKLGYLNEINYIDKRLKKFNGKGRLNEEADKLVSKRKILTNKLKTKR